MRHIKQGMFFLCVLLPLHCQALSLKTVKTKQIARIMVNEDVETMGKAQSLATAVLTSSLSEQFEQAYFYRGDRVKQGQLLFTYHRKKKATQARNPAHSLDTAHIYAPFSGVMGPLQVNPGQLVTPGMPIVELSQLDPLGVRFVLPAHYKDRLKKGLKFEVRTKAQPKKRFTGIIDAIKLSEDKRYPSLVIQAEVDNSSMLLQPNMRLALHLKLGRFPAMVLPKQALVENGEQAAIFSVSKGVAKRVPVKVVRRIMDFVEVSTDFSANLAVVIDEAQLLQDGQLVKVVR